MKVYETLGLWELELFQNKKLVVFVDAVNRELEAPKVMKVEMKDLDVKELVELASSIDPHDVAPSTLALIALASGVLRGDCYIVGVPIENLEPGPGLSTRALIEALKSLKYIERLLDKYDCKVKFDEICIEKEMKKGCVVRA